VFYLITPIHNEINEIDELAHCVNDSLLKPDYWIIVDDNSDDGSSEKLDILAAQFSFIEVIHLKEAASYMEFHISDVFIAGAAAIKQDIGSEDVIGFLDADIRFGKKYWHKLKTALMEKEKLGIISGVLCSKKDNGKICIEPFQRVDNPRGGLRLVKGSCFLEIGGVKRSRSWDSIMNVQARINGWEVKIDEQLFALSTRPTDNKLGNKSGEMSRGRREWHLHQPLWQVTVRAGAKALNGNISSAYYYLLGYLNEWRNRGERFPDDKVRKYYRKERGREWLISIYCKIRGKQSPHRIITVRHIREEEIFNLESEK